MKKDELPAVLFVPSPEWMVIERPEGSDHPGEWWVQWNADNKFTRLKIKVDK